MNLISYKSNKSALITGGTGYIGSNLANYLSLRGWCVAMVSRNLSSTNQLNNLRDNIKIYEFDKTLDSICSIISDYKPNFIFHLASLYITEHKPEDVIPLLESNIVFSTLLLEAASINNVPNFINTGTSWQHYNNSSYDAVNLYASTKQAFESILDYYSASKKIRSVTLKIFDTYGPKDNRGKIVNLLLDLTKSGKLIDMSPGDQLIDLVHIDDIVRAFEIAALNIESQDANHEIYGLSSNNPLTLKQLAQVIESITRKKLIINWAAKNYRIREVMKPWTDFQSLPNWSPKISLLDGLKKILADY